LVPQIFYDGVSVWLLESADLHCAI
jgi:hypothetical protein